MAENLLNADGLVTTTVTRHVLKTAQQRGLRPQRRDDGDLSYARVVLNQKGIEGTFGAIYVGRRSGKILRAVLYRGNSDAVGRRYVGARAVAAAIRELPQ